MTRSTFAFLMTLSLAACAQDTTVYPSLAKRPVEATDLSEPPPAPEAPVAADPALDARIATARTRLRDGTTAFDTVAARAQRLVEARGAKVVGSEAWLDAQTGLGALDNARAVTTAIADDLDAAARDRAAALAPPYPALADTQAAVATEIERQNAASDKLTGALPLD